MLNSIQKRMLKQIEEAPQDRVHWIEIEWIGSFKHKFDNENDPPCQESMKKLMMIWKKAIGSK